MPQQRRRLPFSGKKKKDQLQQKRQMKSSHRYNIKGSNKDESYGDDDGETTEDAELQARKLMEQPTTSGSGRNRNVNRYNLQFYQESKKELEQMRLEGFQPLKTVLPEEREVDINRYYENFDFPKRPPWSIDSDKTSLECNENRYFREYVEQLQKAHRGDSKELSLFELNLETWRQLWRVLEFSDILLIIVDVRYATLMFPPSLYDFIRNTLKKHAILVLNKVDLVAPEVVVAWRHYFQETYPELPIVLFASYPAKKLKGTAKGRMGHKRSMEGVYNIYKECKKRVQGEVDLTSWEQKILEDMREEDLFVEDEVECKEPPLVDKANDDARPCDQPHVMYRDGILTVGCVGFPNVGKSSLINALKGRKVVSVSRTPGHTKHFQTIFLTPVVRLCDCPGLVFPSSAPKYLQVLLGSFPISQLQVPYRSLKFLAEHLNLAQLLKIRLPEDFDEWSAVAIADAWALKRGFLTAKAARPDRYRAANHLLRLALIGQLDLVLQFYPPGFHRDKDKWVSHPEVAEVSKYQNPERRTEEDQEATGDNSESAGSDEASDSSSDGEGSNSADDGDGEDDASSVGKNSNVFALLEDD